MKSLFILPLVVALFAGCSASNNSSTVSTATMNADPKSAGDAFLAANGKQTGVTTTASGLQYKVIESGDGPMPKITDTVKVDYEGTLIDGTVFDSSIQRGVPATFSIQGVIPGWTEALQLMKVGDKWQLFIPAKLAYGDQSPGPQIPANSTLIFQVKLLDIVR